MLYTLADLHLSMGTPKPMDIFGPEWQDYMTRIAKNWSALVGNEDTGGHTRRRLLGYEFRGRRAGGFSFLHQLPGRKIILKGNHDYWWTSLKKMEAFLQRKGFSSISFLHNNSILADGIAVCGARGWHIDPAAAGYDEKILRREIGRLKLSLDHAKAHYPCAPMTVFFHYPPVYGAVCGEPWLALLKEYGVKHCYYGHIHSYGRNRAIVGEYLGICFHLVAADALNFTPVLVRC